MHVCVYDEVKKQNKSYSIATNGFLCGFSGLYSHVLSTSSRVQQEVVYQRTGLISVRSSSRISYVGLSLSLSLSLCEMMTHFSSFLGEETFFLLRTGIYKPKNGQPEVKCTLKCVNPKKELPLGVTMYYSCNHAKGTTTSLHGLHFPLLLLVWHSKWSRYAGKPGSPQHCQIVWWVAILFHL